MKSIYSLPLLFILVLALASCGVKESTQRDINVNSDSMSFSFPVTNNIKDTLKLATLVSKLDMNSLISSVTKQQFNLQNLTAASIIGFQINLNNTDTLANSLKAFQYLSASSMSSSSVLYQFGAVNNNSNQFAKSINFSIIGGTRTFKDELNNGNVTVIIKGTAQAATTKILTGKAVIQYRLTLNK